MRTWTGDSGKTRLFCEEATKDSPRVDVCGDIDELNSFIGLARSTISDKYVNSVLKDIQKDLFVIGADLSKSPKNEKTQLTKKRVEELEDAVNSIEKNLPELKKFILPAGSASILHVCRAVCRRAERKTVALKKSEIVSEETIKYLNRLSTLLFDLARLANKNAGAKEEEW
jgi:cob(I)alamin adenosyltransferase